MNLAAMPILLLSTTPSPAAPPYQAARPAIQVQGVVQGLPSQRVYALLLDRRNRLWAGTQEGLAHLDSRGWTTLPLPSGSRSTLVRALAEGDDGALWVGTEEGGLWRHRGGLWQRSTPEDLRVNALLITRDEGREVVWIATAGSGLQRLDQGVLSRVEAVKDDWIWCLAQISGPEGRSEIWVGGDRALHVLGDGRWEALAGPPGMGLARFNALATARDAQGRPEVLVSMWQLGLGAWDPRSRTFKGLDRGFSSRTATHLLALTNASGRQEVLAATYDQGLQRRVGEGWQTIGPDQGLPSTALYTLLPAPGGHPLVWAGTRDAGLVSVDPEGWRSLRRQDGLPGDSATCFLEAQGAFWIGTDRGLVRWDAKGPRTEGTAQGLPSAAITALALLPGSKGGTLWAGTLQGLARRNGARWEAVGGDPGVPLGRILALAADRNQTGAPVLWAGAENGLGCLEGGRWRLIQAGQGLPARRVQSLLPVQERDGRRSLWIGTRGGGLARLQDGVWSHFGGAAGVSGQTVTGMAESRSPDGQRWLWIAFSGGGTLSRLSLDHPERGFQAFPQLQGILGTTTVHRLAVIHQKQLLVTSPRGVALVALEGPEGAPGEVALYHEADGLPASTTTTGGALLDQEGRIWVGTTSGAAVLDPARRLGPPPRQEPQVEEVLVGGHAWPLDRPLVLGHRDHTLAVSWVLPTYHHREEIQFRSQLLGLEAAPGPWRFHARREFTTLPPRDYVLRIWARDRHGRLCGPRDLPFRVKPAPWERGWVQLLGGLALLGGGVLVLHLRTRLLRDRARELALQVQQRTQDLETANGALLSQSLTDPLTGLGNRRQLDALLPEDLGRVRQGEGGLTFLLLDLDHFKTVNDQYGHGAGDQVLLETAVRLRATLRPGDRVVRWGGEEFLVVAELEGEEAPRLAERLRRAFEEHPFQLADGHAVQLSASVGFAHMPLVTGDPERFSWEHVISLADQCLYQVKRRGRNGWAGLLPTPGAEVPPQGTLPVQVEALVRAGWVTRVASR